MYLGPCLKINVTISGNFILMHSPSFWAYPMSIHWHSYNGQKIDVVYVCPHIYGAALDPPLFPWKFLSAYYTCELGWHMWKSGREGQLYQKTMSLCLTTMLTAHFHHLNETSMNNRKPLVTFSTIGAHSTQCGKIQI